MSVNEEFAFDETEATKGLIADAPLINRRAALFNAGFHAYSGTGRL